MRIPKPSIPTSSPQALVTPDTAETVSHTKSIPTFGESKQSQKPKVDRDETIFILRKCLSHSHANDPNVMGFIAEYLLCRDVKQAALKVGLTKRDGENLRRRPDIHEAIRQITERAVFKHGYDGAEVVAKVKEIMNTDAGDLQRADGSFVESLSEVSAEVRRTIKKFKAKNLYDTDPNGMKVVVGKIIEVEFWDKMKAVELLGREKDLFIEKHKVTHDVTKNMSDTLLESKRLGEEAALAMREAEVIDVTPEGSKDGI